MWPEKEQWPEGPWTHEPDRVEFARAGFPCLLLRSPSGAWCGYVAVPPGHPAHGKACDDVDVEVHGGLTYANRCEGEICHTPRPGESEDVWWLGFDLAHPFDLAPAMLALPWYRRDPSDTYRSLDYARRETERLAGQLAALTGFAGIAARGEGS